MPDPEPQERRRRRRPAVSCKLCRRRKIRCNRESPCSNCVRSRNGNCVYDDPPFHTPLQRQQQQQQQRQQQQQQQEALPPPLPPPSLNVGHGRTIKSGLILVDSAEAPFQGTTFSENFFCSDGGRAGGNIKGVQSATHRFSASSPTTSSNSNTTTNTTPTSADALSGAAASGQSEQSSRPGPGSAASPGIIERVGSAIHGTVDIQNEGVFDSGLFGQGHVIPRSITHKTRLFGQSHWINCAVLTRDIIHVMEPHVRGDSSRAYTLMERCKSLARVAKSRRTPEWPTPLTADLPPREVADELVGCYLRTLETVYRVLHVPTFRREYESIWLRLLPGAPVAEADKLFLVQLKLVLAIGAMTYDETFSLRVSAIRWVYEAQTCLADPRAKSRLTVQGLQAEILLVLAREVTDVAGDLIWISAGSLLRTAIYMGLHRDPTRLPRRTIFANEMRRRLWNTVIEVALLASLTAGGPPLLSEEDFDAMPPGNFDDEQFVGDDAAIATATTGDAEAVLPRSDDQFTQTSVARALRSTFAQRLTVVKFLNGPRTQGSYEETLRLDAQLRAAYKRLSRALQACSSSRNGAGFDTQMVDFVMRRYLCALHVPFFTTALKETAYAFSRKVTVETALKLWSSAVHLPSSSSSPSSSLPFLAGPGDTANANANRDDNRNDIARLALNGAESFRTVVMQAGLLITMELKTQLQEEESLGPISLRPDFLAVLRDAEAWTFRGVELGGTNMKGYLLTRLLNAQIDGLMKGMSRDELAVVLVKTAEEAEERCLPVLEGMVAAYGGGHDEVALDALDQMSLGMSPGVMMKDWDFLMSNASIMYDSGDTEQFGWVF